MQLNKREKSLIELFIKHDLSLTGLQLAEFANVSTKTVYRTIKSINRASSSGDMIVTETGKGYRLDYDKYLKEVVGWQVKSSEPNERRNHILLMLLFKSPNKLLVSELFARYYVSETVISRDISQMETYLGHFNLSLEKSGERICITGAEKNIRKAIDILMKSTYLFGEEYVIEDQQMNPYDVDFISSLLSSVEEQFGLAIPYPYNMNLFAHLYILIKRFREGQVRRNEEELLTKFEEEEYQKYPELYLIAKEMMRKLDGYLGEELPEIEEFYLFQYLVSSRIDLPKNQGVKTQAEIYRITQDFLEKMSQEIGQQLVTQKNIDDLLQHVEPLIYRLKNDIIIKNSLMEVIKLEYGEVFHGVQKVSEEICRNYCLPKISDDENAFLTLYFVRYMELKREKKRIIIMCSSGVGTSELLKVKVSKAFPDLEIVDVLSARKFVKNQADYPDIDLGLTTIKITDPPPFPIILVNAVFTKQDEERVKDMLGEI